MLRQLSSSATRRFSSASFARRYSTATRSAVNQSARPLLFAGVATISGFALATYALSSPILADDKKSVKAPKKEDYIIEESSESKSESDAASKKTEKTTEESTPETPKEDEQPQGAYNPETGEINWDCPCLGGMAHGPCGEDFKTAFSCFVYSEAEPKGVDCIEKFAAMQDCFRQYPEIYSEELRDDAESSSPKEDDKTDAPKADAPKADAPKADAPKDDAPKDDAPKVKTVGSALSDAVSPVTATVTKAAQPVVDYVKPIADAAQPVVDAAKPAAKAIADAAGPVTAAVISSAGPIAHAIAKSITDAIESKEPLLKDNAPVDSDKPSESSQISSDHK